MRSALILSQFLALLTLAQLKPAAWACVRTSLVSIGPLVSNSVSKSAASSREVRCSPSLSLAAIISSAVFVIFSFSHTIAEAGIVVSGSNLLHPECQPVSRWSDIVFHRDKQSAGIAIIVWIFCDHIAPAHCRNECAASGDAVQDVTGGR